MLKALDGVPQGLTVGPASGLWWWGKFDDIPLRQRFSHSHMLKTIGFLH